MKPIRIALAAVLVLVAVSPGRAECKGQSTEIVVTNTNDAGPGSLRQAILDANSTCDVETIRFRIADDGSIRIAPLTPLPPITRAVTIDGTSQPGYAGRPVVALSGARVSSGSGLEVTGRECIVRGLAITEFPEAGIVLSGVLGVVEACHIGTDEAGEADLGNSLAGVHVDGAYAFANRIGGASEAARNVISGNGSGVLLDRARGNTVEGNFIGTDATGSRALGNDVAGVRCDHAFDSTISGNVIGHNGGPGILADRGLEITMVENTFPANAGGAIVYELFSRTSPPEVVFVGAADGGTRVDVVHYLDNTGAGYGPIQFEFFRVRASQSGSAEDAILVGATEVEATPDRVATVSLTLPFALGAQEAIAASVTDPDGSTSKLSTARGDTRGCTLVAITRRTRRTTSVPVGAEAPLMIETVGTGPIAIQWYRYGVSDWEAVPGATATTYVAPAGGGFFRATATNSCGTSEVTVQVSLCTVAPVIDIQPSDMTVPAGDRVNLSVSVTVEPAFLTQYQWYEGQRGDTSRPLIFPDGLVLTPPLTETTSFWVRIANGCGSVDSEAATITVVPAMEIDSVRVVGSGAKAKIVARGRNFDGEVVFVLNAGELANASFEKPAKISGSKVTQRGRLRDGRTIDEAIPRGCVVRIGIFGEHGEGEYVEYTRP